MSNSIKSNISEPTIKLIHPNLVHMGACPVPSIHPEMININDTISIAHNIRNKYKRIVPQSISCSTLFFVHSFCY